MLVLLPGMECRECTTSKVIETTPLPLHHLRWLRILHQVNLYAEKEVGRDSYVLVCGFIRVKYCTEDTMRCTRRVTDTPEDAVHGLDHVCCGGDGLAEEGKQLGHGAKDL